MIQASHLVKRFGPTLAVDDVSFDLPRGEVVGFLGPNGAGKSTTMRMLTGALPPSSGQSSIAGHDVLHDAAAARRKLGYLPENNPLYPEMRVDEFLHYAGRLHRMPRPDRLKRIDYTTDRCGLTALRRRTIGRLSKGNRQRVGLAAALLHDPPALVLDEPTAGLDPHQVGQVRQLIAELKGDHTVLLSTHLLPEAQRVCSHILMIAAGRLVASGSLGELQSQAGHIASQAKLWVQVKADALEVAKRLSEVQGVGQATAHDLGEGWCEAELETDSGDDPRPRVARAVADRGWPLREIRREAGSLESFFIRMTDPTKASLSSEVSA
jgi:ABC-2 type transport system ATP-binding protein